MFMETIAAILILFPVLLQVATQVGVDPIQFGLVCVMNLVIGLTTPPVGVCLFAATAIGGNKLSENVKALVPFMIALFAVLFLVTYVPAVSVGFMRLFTGG
jgi:TRAP-type C4-dicarboxylate transport system permease large subunit